MMERSGGAPFSPALARALGLAIYAVYFLWLALCVIGLVLLPVLLAILLYMFFSWLGASAATFWLWGIPLALGSSALVMYSTLRDLSTPRPYVITVEREECGLPWLSAILSDLEKRFAERTTPFTHVEITGDIDLSTYQRGRRRVLVIGSAVTLMPEQQLAAAIAHECAHHLDDAMHYHRAVWYVTRGVLRWEQARTSGFRSLKQRTSSLFFSYAYQAATIILMPGWLACQTAAYFLVMFLLGRRATNHEYELYCDNEAARVCSPAAFADALVNILALRAAYEAFCRSTITAPDHHALSRFVASVSDGNGFTLRCKESISHPSLASRLRRLAEVRNLHHVVPRLGDGAAERTMVLGADVCNQFRDRARETGIEHRAQQTARSLAAATNMTDPGYLDRFLTIVLCLERHLNLDVAAHFGLSNLPGVVATRVLLLKQCLRLLALPNSVSFLGRVEQNSEIRVAKAEFSKSAENDEVFYRLLRRTAEHLVQKVL